MFKCWYERRTCQIGENLGTNGDNFDHILKLGDDWW